MALLPDELVYLILRAIPWGERANIARRFPKRCEPAARVLQECACFAPYRWMVRTLSPGTAVYLRSDLFTGYLTLPSRASLHGFQVLDAPSVFVPEVCVTLTVLPGTQHVQCSLGVRPCDGDSHVSLPGWRRALQEGRVQGVYRLKVRVGTRDQPLTLTVCCESCDGVTLFVSMHVTLLESDQDDPWFIIKGSRYFSPVVMAGSEVLWPPEVLEEGALCLPPAQSKVVARYVTPDGDCEFLTFSDGTTVKFCTGDLLGQVSLSLALVEGLLLRPHTM
jgi:hypothetical protein